MTPMIRTLSSRHVAMLCVMTLTVAAAGCRGTGIRSPLSGPGRVHAPTGPLGPAVSTPPRPPVTDFRPVEITPSPRATRRPTPAPAPKPAPNPPKAAPERGATDYSMPAPTPPAPVLDAPTLGISHESPSPRAPRLLPGLTSVTPMAPASVPVSYERFAPADLVTLGRPVFDVR